MQRYGSDDGRSGGGDGGEGSSQDDDRGGDCDEYYSPTTHKAYCFLCYLYKDKPNEQSGHSAFSCEGFDNWKKVNDWNNCPFLKHIKSSTHKKAFVFATNLVNKEAHVENFIEKESEEQIRKNRLRLKGTIDVVHWLQYQACTLRGHDESSNSKNQGNFLELLKLLVSYNDDLVNVILANAPRNCKYTSFDIQQEVLSIMANKVRKYIREEVGDSWFCVMVDESRDESKKEQMAIVLRFVDAKGVIRERFLDTVHVENTVEATLKASLWNRLLNQNFDTGKICGQGYDGASNMSGEWNGLQALVRQHSPYAYYIHCFAHSNCHNELQKAKAIEIKELLELGEIKSGKGKN
uniref:zinc finger MYM-type protein 1-like n=1 Tax=Erigeron canadensis TaxID=72917 RepID=UPI001CB8BD5F|nr:zinc finger MYM-type protein 1-like [Erigeron canadensis]